MSISKDLTPLIEILADLGDQPGYAKITLPAAVEDGLNGAVDMFTEQQCALRGVKFEKSFDIENDYFTLSGVARTVRAILTGVNVLLNSEISHSLPVEAGLLYRGRIKKEIAYSAARLGLICYHNEYWGLLESTLIFHLHGKTADVAALMSAVKDFDDSMNGRPPLAQRRAKLLKDRQLGL